MTKYIFNIYKDAFSGLSTSVWLLCFIMFINRAGAMVLPFMTLYLTTSLHFSLTDAGWIMGAYGLGSIAGAYIGGQFTDRIGYYHIQFYSLIIGASLLILLVFLTGFLSILLTVFFFSLISDTLRPANSVAIAAYAKPENRTRSFSLMRFAINLGFSIGPAMGGIVAGSLGFKWIFVIDALTCLFAAYLLHRYLPYKPISSNIKSDSYARNEQSAYSDKKYLIFIFLVCIYAVCFFQLFTSIPVFWGKEWGFSETKIGLLLALNGLIIVVFEMPFIRHLEHIQRYMVMVSIGSALLITGFICLIAGWIHMIPALLFIVFMTVSEMFSMPFMTNYAVSKPSENRRGQYMALYSMAYGFAHIVAPLGGLYIADVYGFRTLYLMLMLLSILVTIGFFSIRRSSIIA